MGVGRWGKGKEKFPIHRNYRFFFNIRAFLILCTCPCIKLTLPTYIYRPYVRAFISSCIHTDIQMYLYICRRMHVYACNIHTHIFHNNYIRTLLHINMHSCNHAIHTIILQAYTNIYMHVFCLKNISPQTHITWLRSGGFVRFKYSLILEMGSL